MAFGVDIGGTKVLGIALDAASTVVAEARVATPRGRRPGDGAEVANAVVEVVAQLDAAAGTGSTRVGVGHHRSVSAPPAWWTARDGCASRPICPRGKGWTGGS